MQSRKLSNRRISKFKRKQEKLGETDTHLRDILQKPILTKRDKAALLSVYYHRCLTTEQLAEMHFRYKGNGDVNTQSSLITRRRLRKMFDYHLIDRFFIDVGENNGSSQQHVVLDTIGARVVAGLLNLSVEELSWRYEMNNARLPYLQHMVSINDFYINMLRAARYFKGEHEVGDFRTENHVRHEFKYWGSKMVFNPDAYGQYFIGDSGVHFFLELDNNTMTPATFVKKHQRYSAFYESDEYLKYYDNFPMILTVAPTWERAVALRNCICAADDTDMVWLFTAREYVEDNVLGNIWIGKEGTLVSLFD